MQWTFYHIPLFAGAVFAFVLGAFVLRYRQARGGRPLLRLLIFAALFCLVYAVQLAHTSLSASLFWSRVTFPMFSLTALFFLLFAVEYTNREDWVTGFRVLLLAVPLVFTSVAPWLWSDQVYQNPRMGEQLSVTLLRFEVSGVYLLVLGIVYAYTLTAIVLVLIQYVRSGRAGVFQRQQLAIVGLSIPPLAALIQEFFSIRLALAPVSFVVTGFVLTVAIFRYQLLDVLPIARQRVFQHVDAGVLVVGPDGRILDANPWAQQLFAETELVNNDFDSLDVPAETTDLNGSDESDVWERSRRDGERRIYEIEYTPISDAYDQFNGWVVLFYDVTDREQRKQELKRQRDELEEKTEALERKNERLNHFASVVSHDLRNPLNVAQGRLSLARETGDEEQFEEVSHAHDRMAAMIDELLALARTETAIDETDVESISVETVVSDAWATAETNDASLETDIPQGWTIDAAPTLVRNILENLFRNAADHNESPVTVTVGTIDGEGFYVEDNGIGIPEEKREEVLEHGYTTDEQGTGFGLSIVQELVAAHGWTINITETPEGGARFEITGVNSGQ